MILLIFAFPSHDSIVIYWTLIFTLLLKNIFKLGMVVHAYNSSYLEGRLKQEDYQVQDKPGHFSETLSQN